MEDFDTDHHTGHLSDGGSGQDSSQDHCGPSREVFWTVSDHAIERMIKRFGHLLTPRERVSYDAGFMPPIRDRMVEMAAQSRKTRELQSNARFMMRTRVRHAPGTIYRNFDDVVFVCRRGVYEGQLVIITVVKLSEQLQHLESMTGYTDNRKGARTIVRKKTASGRNVYRYYAEP